MAQITYDRLIGPEESTTEADETTTTLTVADETAPTTFTPVNYVNFVFQVSAPGDTTSSTPATATDTQSSTYTLIKEVKFANYVLDIFSKTATSVNVDTTVTVTHPPTKNRIIVGDEWYNLQSLERTVSSYASSATAQVETGEFKVGNKKWLVYAVLAVGGLPHDDTINIPDDWNLILDTGTNEEATDVRLVLCYQIADKRKKVIFRPLLSTARVWGSVMFGYKGKN